MTNDTLTLGIPGFSFADLFSPEALARLYQIFQSDLKTKNQALFETYKAYAENKQSFSQADASDLLCQVAPFVSAFIVDLFGESVRKQTELIKQKTSAASVIFRFKDQFVKRRMQKRPIPQDKDTALQLGFALLDQFQITDFTNEQSIATLAEHLLQKEKELLSKEDSAQLREQVREQINTLSDFLLISKDELLAKHHWQSLQFPSAIDYQNLVPLQKKTQGGMTVLMAQPEKARHRDGFHLTDKGMSFQEVLKEVDDCLYCHIREKDSCRHGFKEKDGSSKKNPLGVSLDGCPLGEKISEMNLLKQQGDPIAALALVCIDNPMCPGTGHRICNDCMKSCIYQKQTPINVPQIETGVLKDVLELPFGVEIYGLLTRFNPLNVKRPYPLPYRGKNVLVVGLGPAGYTLSHYLSKEGFGVVGIDGMMLEPPLAPYTGNLREGQVPTPVYDYKQLWQDLSDRPALGFGGVSEYGITVRWDKNYLSLIYLTLCRQAQIRFYGGIRFGGTLSLEDAWQQGFDHVAMAAGAGKPTLLSIENNLCRGMRQASDFLMSLQLQKPYQPHSLSNLQVRLPALIIGGGLTAIDTATELLAYYVTQAEKTLSIVEQITETHKGTADSTSLAAWMSHFDQEEQEILQEQIVHGKAFRNERMLAKAQERAPKFAPLLSSFGGATVVYRKRLTDSPAYHLNHEEVEKSIEEGVQFLECLRPQKAQLDAHQALCAMQFSRQIWTESGWYDSGQQVTLPAKTVLVAAGTRPNTMYEQEHAGTFLMDKNGYFSPHRAYKDESGTLCLEKDRMGVFTSHQNQGNTVSFYGDNHPAYAGSVVKAMASAKNGFSQVAALFDPHEPKPIEQFTSLCSALDRELQATVFKVQRLSESIVEVVISAPMATRKFKPGQFYRLQTFDVSARSKHEAPWTMEGLALTGASADRQNGLLSLIVLEMGTSSKLVRFLQAGDPVTLMGPTGTPTEIPAHQTVCLVGGGLGNAVLFSIAKALKQNGCKVIYFAGYRKPEDMCKQADIESHADQVIWSCDQKTKKARLFCIQRPQDRFFFGNIVDAMLAYAKGALGGEFVRFDEIDHMIVIGSDRMMSAVKQAQKTLFPPMKKNATSVASINSPMLCMMKEICAQCLQRQVDPVLGERFVFSCVHQDQPLDHVDFEHLSARLRQNSMQEKLSSLWLDVLTSSQKT